MTETHPIPQIAKTAANLLVVQFRRDLDALGVQTLAAMGHTDSPDWKVDFDAGTIAREISDAGHADQVGETPPNAG